MTTGLSTSTGAPGGLEHLYSRQTRAAQPSAIRDICALVARPEIRSLAGGWPDPAVFPMAEVGDIFAELFKSSDENLLQYGATEGLAELRAVLAERMGGEGVACLSADNILITHGSAQGMNLAAQVFVDQGDAVAVGLPTYFGGPGAVRAMGGLPMGVPVDGNGMDTAALAETIARLKWAGRRVKAVYVIPNFQNPTGVTLTLDRRQELLALAEEHDLIVIEDDPYVDLRFEGEHLPSLLSMDGSGRVIQLRSLSKTFVPGFRLGWAVASSEVIRRMSVAKQFVDAVTNTPAQFVLLEYIRRGLLDKRIADNIRYYRAKRDHMLALMDEHFPHQVSWNRPWGGFFLFVHLPQSWDAAELFDRAVERNVAFITGQPFFVDHGGANTFRLSFSQASAKEMEAAIAELGRLIRTRLD